MVSAERPRNRRFATYPIAAVRSRRFAEANRRTITRLKALGWEDNGETLLVDDFDFNLAICDAADVPYGDVVRVRLGLKDTAIADLPAPQWMAGALGIPPSHTRRIYRALGLPTQWPPQ